MSKMRRHAPKRKLPSGMMPAVAAQIKAEAQKIVEAEMPNTVRELTELLMVLPTVVILDSFGKLMPKQDRIKTFMALVYEQYQYIESGEVNLEELKAQIEEEIGEKLDWRYV